MCTIIGFKYSKNSILQRMRIEIFLRDILLVRGRDGIGITIYNPRKDQFKTKYIGKDVIIKFPKEKIVTSVLNIIDRNSIDKSSYVLIHARAIPETENTKMLQPIRYKNIFLVHNGLIYNDKEVLPNKYHDKIDSLAIAYYLNSNEANKNIFKRLKGSYSILYIDKENRYFGYITNYQPLFKYHSINDNFSIYTNIEPKYLLTDDFYVTDIEPYTCGIIETF